MSRRAAIVLLAIAGTTACLAAPAPDDTIGAAVAAQRSAAYAGAASTRGPRGARGARGYRGAAGAAGVLGDAGTAGTSGSAGPAGPAGASLHGGLATTAVTVNWQNGAWQGRERASTAIPGIGTAEVVCSPGENGIVGAQWLRIFPSDDDDEVTLWTVVQQHDVADPGGHPDILTVKTARKAPGTGPDFNEGLNMYRGQLAAQGAFSSILSSRGPASSAGGPRVAPTTVRLSFHWDFRDPSAARCYVAATFETAS